ncbi:MAG: cardiolipin synthase [Microbacteriaceae bacterium]|nr:cardiolipin synthase [Microbacteriaceae bacterium]
MTFTEVLFYLLTVVDLALRLIAIYVVPMNRRPQTAMAWLLLIFFFPIGGFIIFWMFGVSHLPIERVAKQDEISRIIAGRYPQQDLGELGQPDWFDASAKMNRALGAMPLVGGNNAKFFPDYQESLDAMVEAINSAKQSVFCEFYIMYRDDTSAAFFDALVAAKDRGVEVKVLVDHIASWRYPRWTKTTVKFLNKSGLNWRKMLPINPFKGHWRRPDLRNHRKLLVIDNELAFTGSQNIIDSQYVKKSNIRRGLHWKDLMVSFTGPVVSGIHAMFVSDWYAETGELLSNIESLNAKKLPKHKAGDLLAQVVPSGPAFKDQNNLKLFNTLMYAATEKIVITSPYFVPDDSMFYAITSAVDRGVNVELFVSEIGDQFLVYHAQCSYYEALLEAGVKIWCYEAPTILHAKHITVDNNVAVFGSSNLDMRSFALNLEISMMVWGKEFLDQLQEIEDSYREKSTQLELSEWRKRSFWKKLAENICRPTASLQ